MTFRTAKLSDLPRLYELEQKVVEAERPFNSSIKSESASYYDIESLIENPNSCLLVAEIAEQIIATGYAQIRDSKRSLNHEQHAYLGFMYVAPEHRGQGLNQQLIDELITWCKSEGIFDFYLDVYLENESAVKAYEKAGFTPTLLEMKLNL